MDISEGARRSKGLDCKQRDESTPRDAGMQRHQLCSRDAQYLAHVAFRQELVDKTLSYTIPHCVQLITDRSRVLVVLRSAGSEEAG